MHLALCMVSVLPKSLTAQFKINIVDIHIWYSLYFFIVVIDFFIIFNCLFYLKKFFKYVIL
jgi:hypothetical protein